MVLARWDDTILPHVIYGYGRGVLLVLQMHSCPYLPLLTGVNVALRGQRQSVR